MQIFLKSVSLSLSLGVCRSQQCTPYDHASSELHMWPQRQSPSYRESSIGVVSDRVSRRAPLETWMEVWVLMAISYTGWRRPRSARRAKTKFQTFAMGSSTVLRCWTWPWRTWHDTVDHTLPLPAVAMAWEVEGDTDGEEGLLTCPPSCWTQESYSLECQWAINWCLSLNKSQLMYSCFDVSFPFSSFQLLLSWLWLKSSIFEEIVIGDQFICT